MTGAPIIEWVAPGRPLPDPRRSTHPEGLVAAGIDLDADRLEEAYRKGLFPWSSDPSIVLWWSPDPRMVALPTEFAPHRSLRKTLRRVRAEQRWTLTMDTAFTRVMRECAAPRRDGPGTWITEPIIDAYTDLHRRGMAHSFEIWDPSAGSASLVGGLYGVSIGRMFFGESMFARATDASKCGYAAMMALLGTLGIAMVDCQQETSHLGSLGARPIGRERFLDELRVATSAPPPNWNRVVPEWPEI